MAKGRKPLTAGDKYWIVAMGTPHEMRDGESIRTKTTAKAHLLAFFEEWQAWAKKYDEARYETVTDEFMRVKKITEIDGYSWEQPLGTEDYGWTVRVSVREEVFKGGTRP